MERQIRNICIIAHIDHGKSTLADRLIERAGIVEHADLLLDSMDLERERGITIKAAAVALDYNIDGSPFRINLIDTPGHVDFSYEVSRSLKACEGAVLLVDAAQGVEAQTISNFYLALEEDLEIIPVLNKIDLPVARPDEVRAELEAILGIDPADVLEISAKTGEGVERLIEEVARRVPPPTGSADKPLRALIFDAQFNDYRGVIVYLRVFDGTIRPGDKIQTLATNRTYEVQEVGIFRPQMEPTQSLSAGEVGYLIAGIKQIRDVRVGDTITYAGADVEPLGGYREPKPMVFCSFYPDIETESERLRRALEKLSLNDAALFWEPEFSEALGLGFRCGFLGLLHMEITQERLERELNVGVVQTAPSVQYQVVKKSGEVELIDAPSKLPDAAEIAEIREPIVEVSIVLPNNLIGSVMRLCDSRRGKLISTQFLSPTRSVLIYRLPLAEIIYDFYDRLKSVTRGLATMDYEFKGFERSDLVRLDILVHGRRVDPLSVIVHRQQAYHTGKRILQILKKEIPRHLFQVTLQAAIGSRVIARENIKPLAKNVTAKCYGGDVTRKMKLLKKQREGKKRMKQVGRVTMPQSAFLAVLKRNEDR